MKRSEMVEIIHDVISTELQTVNEFNYNDCDNLLRLIEKAGMLPPFVTVPVEPSNIIVVDGSVYPGQAKWER